MEMKYLVEQDTGNIYLPAVHVSGIIGLDINTDLVAKSCHFSAIDGENYIDMDLNFIEFDKVICAILELNFTHPSTEVESAYNTLLQSGFFHIQLPSKNLLPIIAPMSFNAVAYDSDGNISGDVEVSIRYTNDMIAINAALTKRYYGVDSIGNVVVTTLPLSLSKIVATANGIVVGGR